MSARDRNAGYDAQMADARETAGEPTLDDSLRGLIEAVHRLTLTLELERLERLDYARVQHAPTVRDRRRLRMGAIRAELGLVS